MSRPKQVHEMLAVLTESGRREVEKFNAEQSRISEQERYIAELAVLVNALKLAEKLSISNDECVLCDSDFAADFGITGELSHQLHCPFVALSTHQEQAESLLADAALGRLVRSMPHNSFLHRFIFPSGAPDTWSLQTNTESHGLKVLGSATTPESALTIAARTSEKGE